MYVDIPSLPTYRCEMYGACKSFTEGISLLDAYEDGESRQHFDTTITQTPFMYIGLA